MGFYGCITHSGQEVVLHHHMLAAVSSRLQIHALPSEISKRQQKIGRFSADIATRDADAGEEFSLRVGNRVCSGKGARGEGATALTQ